MVLRSARFVLVVVDLLIVWAEEVGILEGGVDAA